MKARQTQRGLRYAALLTEEERQIILSHRRSRRPERPAKPLPPLCIYRGCFSRTKDESGICGIHRRMQSDWIAKGREETFKTFFAGEEVSLPKPKQQCEVSEWQGCYRDGWKGLIVEAAFAHPAKYARGLIHRIYRHAFEQGWVQIGDTVVDPFGGIALGGFDSAQLGLNWIGCELEEKFVKLGNENIAEWQHRYGHRAGYGSVRLVQGDSRRLSEVLIEAGLCVSSPPFQDNNVNIGGVGNTPGMRQQIHNSTKRPQSYGSTKGNLGNLPATEAGLNLAISSPPYHESLASDNPETRGGLFRDPKRKNDKSLTATYGESDGQLGAMKESSEGFTLAVSSPPYADIAPRNDKDYDEAKLAEAKGKQTAVRATWGHNRGSTGQQDYGDSPGQLGAMRDKGFDLSVSSPPWENIEIAGEVKVARFADHPTVKVNEKFGVRTFNKSNPANLGNDAGQDFWSAARQIVEETYKVLAPGAHAIWVVKGFVRNKAYVDFPDQWRQLCEAVGFETLHWHNASLVEQGAQQQRLDGGTDSHSVERKKFLQKARREQGKSAHRC